MPKLGPADGGIGRLVSESAPGDGGVKDSIHIEEDLSYAKSLLGVEEDQEQGTHKILGTQWDATRDIFLFDIRVVADAMENSLSRPSGVSLVPQPSSSTHLELPPQ